MTERCGWVGDDPLYQAYHDTEWGRPVTDSRSLWEMLTLEGFQAGLSWITILRKRQGFRRAFQGFDPAVIATWGEAEVERLLGDAGIIRHRGKIEAVIGNAQAYLRIEGAGGFAPFIWGFVDGKPQQGRRAGGFEVPASTPASEHMSKALKKQGFRFCGPTTCYAFMQAAGLVNDHVLGCHSHESCLALGEAFEPLV